MRPEARVGTIFNQWRLESLITADPLAATYSATRFHERASFEILHDNLASSAATRDRFLGLADVRQRIDHAGVVRVIEAGTTRDDSVFLMTESLSGLTLEAAWRADEGDRLSGGARSLAPTQPTMRLERALPIFASLLDCLAAVHDAGVLHRGLRPSSILLSEHDRIKLLGLGAAAVHDIARAPRARLGATAYMAPEQAMGLVDQLDLRVDLFSVGAMMHALFTGHEINDAATEQASLVMAATKPQPPVSVLAPHLSQTVAAIIDKALEWDRRRRFSSAREMRQALVAAMRAA